MSGKRVLAVYAALLLGFAVVLCRLYLLALHPAYAARAAAQSTVTLQLPARRPRRLRPSQLPASRPQAVVVVLPQSRRLRAPEQEKPRFGGVFFMGNGGTASASIVHAAALANG